MSLPPLVIDLDGTLVFTDMLHESALKRFRDKPFDTLRIPYWLWQGKAILKHQLAQHNDFDPSDLPYNYPFLEWLKEQRAQGRKLVLCTASDIAIAEPIANHLGIFDEVLASDGIVNLAGKQKAKSLIDRFGKAGFDYAGNSKADLHVWQHSNHAVTVNTSKKTVLQAAALCEITQDFPAPPLTFRDFRRMLRIHQWLKNILLFVPFIAAHQIFNLAHWLELLLAFISFSLCASSVYIANDLMDLESDRQHPRKCTRPFASGLVSVWIGALLAPSLLAISIGLGQFVGGNFLAWLLFYFVLTCVYSWGIKRVIIVDCLTLALLYTLRVIAGASAANLGLSFWLLAFSVFLFLSLAFVKRYAELQVQVLNGKLKIHGRGYLTSDAPIIQMMGITSGYAAALVLALYLNSNAVTLLYKTPEFIWGTVPLILFWISWMWMQAHRGNMHDDPLVFAIKDKASLLVGFAFAIVLILGVVV